MLTRNISPGHSAKYPRKGPEKCGETGCMKEPRVVYLPGQGRSTHCCFHIVPPKHEAL